MYLDTFGFDEPPFSITPDPKFVFLSQKHQESLAHLVYGITRGGGAGFVQLTGEVGTGKTTISRLLLEQIPEKTNIALILNPVITPLELIQNICKELKVSMRGIKTKLNTLVDKLNDYLLKSWANGENTVVIIDEAQNLPRDTLEQLRLLTNLETDKQKLLQIVLIGQPELRATMRRDDLRQLAQRVTARYHLMPLDAQETYKYLQHRIAVAGSKKGIVNKSVANKIYKLTGGVPRLINILTDRALLSAYSDNSPTLNTKHINVAAKEVLPESHKKASGNLIKISLSLLTLVILIYLGNEYSKIIAQDINEFYKLDKPNLPEVANAVKLPANKIAWNKYFKIWDAKTDKNWRKASCPSSSESGMACVRRQGNLKQILKLNHPVIVQLENESLALLLSTKEKQLGIFNQNDGISWIQKAWLDKQWLGTYFIIWPMPAQLLVEPSAKDLSNWALEMANTIASDKITASQLSAWIKNFQKENSLLADGIIGKETQMALALAAYNGPTLTN
jgi:general secretion pathway protein A